MEQYDYSLGCRKSNSVIFIINQYRLFLLIKTLISYLISVLIKNKNKYVSDHPDINFQRDKNQPKNYIYEHFSSLF